MQDLGRMGVFAVVAEELSMSKAAEKLGTTRSAVSKQVIALEAELGVKLLYRNARNSRLTDEGQTLYPICLEILDRYLAVKDIAEQFNESPAGNLSLEMPDGIATYVILPHLQRFQQQYPLIKLNIKLRQASIQELSKGLDVGIVAGPLPDSSAVSRLLGNQSLGPYASREYLEQHGVPTVPADFSEHTCIVTQASAAVNFHRWGFRYQGEFIALDIKTGLVVNDILAIKQLVLNGGGISILPEFAVRQEVEQGKLIRLLPGYDIPPVPINVIFPVNKQLSPKIRVMVDFLVECFALAEFS